MLKNILNEVNDHFKINSKLKDWFFINVNYFDSLRDFTLRGEFKPKEIGSFASLEITFYICKPKEDLLICNLSYIKYTNTFNLRCCSLKDRLYLRDITSEENLLNALNGFIRNYYNE